MYDLLKIEGRIHRLEIYDDSLSAFGKSGDAQIAASAILSGVAESVSLSAQTVFLASKSRLHVQSIVMEIDEKVCIGQFHRALLKENEYVICIAKKLENNLYELYSVLSPKTGLLHMQVGMGESVEKNKKGLKKEGLIYYGVVFFLFSIIFLWATGINSENLFFWLIISVFGYIVINYVVKKAGESLIYLCEKSEKVFNIYGFYNADDLSLLKSRYISDEYKLLLESVYEYRKVIEQDPYPESYIEQKERNV
ncbi:putative type VI secretion system effector [Acinetobacter venetianus]|uniref:putative type VI secretion system effector n=2 Tax=Acinetobacter venetianus TaxID=52133 RepID=UPI0028A1DE9E|nr:putative type VI secretion system effector [Acinetobacter venetianus]